MNSGTMSEAANEITSVVSSGASSATTSGANSGVSSGVSKEVGVVLRVNFAGPNRGLVASTEPQWLASSHKGEECSSEPIKDEEDVRRVCRYFADSGNNLMLTLFVLGVNTAYRISDILSLRWEEVITSGAVSTNRPEKKTDKRRLVYLNDTVQAALANWHAECGDCAVGYVFGKCRQDCVNRNCQIE